MTAIRSPAGRVARLVLVAAAVTGAMTLGGCGTGSDAGDAPARLRSAVERADLGWTAVRAEVVKDGFARDIALGLVTDGDAVDSDAIRSTLEVTLDTVGDDGFSRIALTVRHGDDRGELLAVWPACAEIGFTRRASESDVRFSQPVSTVREVLGR